MKVLELYEDLFQYICRLNRVATTEAQPDYTRVRSEIKTILDDINRNASADVRLRNQADKLELPIIFFVDNVIATSPLKSAAQGAQNRRASDRREWAGDERFFDFFEQDKADP